jgi:hypothetical protein
MSLGAQTRCVTLRVRAPTNSPPADVRIQMVSDEQMRSNKEEVNAPKASIRTRANSCSLKSSLVGQSRTLDAPGTGSLI